MFEHLFQELDHEEILGLTDEAKALYLYNYFLHKKKSIVVVTSSLYEANKLYQSLSNYTDEAYFFPMDDFLTSEALAISPDLKIHRLETLNEIVYKKKSIVVTNLMGYLRYLPTKENYLKHQLTIKADMDIDMKQFVTTLYEMGYTRETIVNKTGEMSVRGFVIDLFPLDFDHPIRIEFWGDTIDSIREFNIDTQLTEKELSEISIVPCSEMLVSTEEEIKQKDLPKYMEVASINSYLDHPVVAFSGYHDLENSYLLLKNEMKEYSEDQGLDPHTKYMFDLEEIPTSSVIYLNNFDNRISSVSSTKSYHTSEVPVLKGNMDDIKKQLAHYLKQYRLVLLCVETRYHLNKIEEEFKDLHPVITNENELYDHKINVILKNIREGFVLEAVIVLSEREIFGKKEYQKPLKTNFKFGTKIRDINKLNIGDYVVHSVHGIGRYCGIKTLTKNGLKKDYLQIEYRDKDKLYIPVEKIEFINKYSNGDGVAPKLNKLGSTEWEKTKLRVKKKIENIAGDLLKLYAERERTQGFAFSKDTEEQAIFESQFPYEETADQLKVIEEIKSDMEKPVPMDRLLCGDVGFGKTEVAFRAMFKAIMDGKQVAMLCPTTILSSQHYENALERFKEFPVNIALLNRFVSSKETKSILSRLKEGKIDILIGTHRILSNDIQYKDLGLLVVDEEQRFGVKHKEKIKSYKTNIDVLTLSATPIPRTLQMSMSGIRNLSLIETAPVNRYPVQTYVLAENKAMIKDAIYKELSRNGQVFILYNRVSDMERKAKEISHLVPDARIVTAHGQMNQRDLEDVMVKFINHEYDVMLCTTIIETGIDIPRVNTLIVIDADRFGLAQLYQLRGRVGRSDKIAYCYLMYEPVKQLTDIATKRLKVIKDFTELGSGFAIAMRDLSIRGAGDILGSEQAGFVDSVGIELFLKMLNEKVDELKGNTKEKELNTTSQPLIEVETSIDDHYVEEEELKIEIHQKINEINSYAALLKVKKELEDRFGHISESLLIYMHEEWFEKQADELGIKKVKQLRNFIEVTLPESLTNKINGDTLFMKVNELSRMFRFKMIRNELIIVLDTVKLESHFIYYLIDLMKAIKESLKTDPD